MDIKYQIFEHTNIEHPKLILLENLTYRIFEHKLNIKRQKQSVKKPWHFLL